MANTERLLHCVAALTTLVSEPGGRRDSDPTISAASLLLRELVAVDDWLPDAFAKPDEPHYRQYLLYADPLDRFSLVSFVWGPGQKTPIHNHTIWGVIAVLRGAELAQRYELDAGRLVAVGPEERLDPGSIDVVSPAHGDIHSVRNAFADRTSISIHLYGGNIGRIRRSVFERATGEPKAFVSGYSSDVVPNLWPNLPR
jgi:predicted metal-dependent enzyme (double-stranded beta helix superfamily)